MANLAEPWNVVFLVGFVLYLGIRSRYARQLRGVKSVHRQVDSMEKMLLIVVIVNSMIWPVLYLFTPLLSFADYELPEWAPWVGLPVVLLALWLFWRSHADLGLNWSATLEIRDRHRLVRQGVYRRIRHPMYAAIFLFSIAQALMLANWLAGFSALVPFTLMYILRTPREERMMVEFFGEDYRRYMNETGRLFPRLMRSGDSSSRQS
jgi:protein-S-isoprenylcysteine O-methyltransferase Ste14